MFLLSASIIFRFIFTKILCTRVLNILYGPYNKLLYFHCGKSKMAAIPVVFLWVRQNGQVPGQVDM